jgi:hypothetical protein
MIKYEAVKCLNSFTKTGLIPAVCNFAAKLNDHDIIKIQIRKDIILLNKTTSSYPERVLSDPTPLAPSPIPNPTKGS